MLFDRNRKDGNPEIANRAMVYLNGIKQERCLQAQTRTASFTGHGYVICYDRESSGLSLYGLPVAKHLGFVEVRIS